MWLCVELLLSLPVRASSLSPTHQSLTPMTPRLWPSTQRSASSQLGLWLLTKSEHKFNSKMTHTSIKHNTYFIKTTAAVRTKPENIVVIHKHTIHKCMKSCNRNAVNIFKSVSLKHHLFISFYKKWIGII